MGSLLYQKIASLRLNKNIRLRVLDAQYFGVPQRRRLFIVGHSGNWRCAAAVLFERDSLRGHPAPRRKTRPALTAAAGARARSGGGFSAKTQMSGEGAALGLLAPVACDNRARGCYGSGAASIAPTLRAHPHGGAQMVVAINLRGRKGGATAELSGETATALRASQGGGDKLHVLTRARVRRLTAREYERLQGFPDDYTLVPYRGKLAADSPRYRALGNSMAVPVMRWLGERIAQVDHIEAAAREAA